MPSVSGLKILFSLAPLELSHGPFQNDRKTSDSNKNIYVTYTLCLTNHLFSPFSSQNLKSKTCPRIRIQSEYIEEHWGDLAIFSMSPRQGLQYTSLGARRHGGVLG